MKLFAALALGLLATPAFADAVTYEGTIGNIAIVMELSEEPNAGNADLFGRYFYVGKGIDIPLHAAPATRSRFGLVEEEPCREDGSNCPHAMDDQPSDPPLGARWQLEVEDDGARLVGEWSAGGRDRPVTLTRTATRPFDPAEGMEGLLQVASGLLWLGTVLNTETSPYDVIKMQEPLRLGDPVEMSGGSFRYVSDPRTVFEYPRIASLDAGDPAAANAFLEQRHWAMGLDALWCKAQAYQGFGWNEYTASAVGTLGEYDNEEIKVSYLSPTVMSWTEAGSLYCGGAHPYNHHEFFNLDVRTGELLDLSRIFADWVPRHFDGTPADLEEARANPREYDWLPGEKLAAYVKANRLTDEELGFSAESECPIDELIDTNLAIGFTNDDTVLFSLDGLPNAIQACSGDLFEIPIEELEEFLTPEAATYFPSVNT